MTALHHSVHGPEGAPVVVLSSSLGATSAMWEPQIAALSRTHRVIAYDHRGHGASPAPPGPYTLGDIAGDALELLDALGLERVSFCGVSLGGMVGMWLAARAPERIDRLVACCTTARFADPQPWRERIAAVRAAGSTEPVADAIVSRWLTPLYAAAHPELLASLRAMLVGVDADGYASACEAIERMDLRDELPRIAAPTLVIGATHDEATPPEHQQAIAAAIPGARLEILDGAAHLAGLERPDEVTALIRDHIEETR